MAGSIPLTTTASTRPSIRAALMAATVISAVTLSIATFELSMADWPSGFVLLGVLPLAALLFCGCATDGASRYCPTHTKRSGKLVPRLVIA